jgi:hypothetical protein
VVANLVVVALHPFPPQSPKLKVYFGYFPVPPLAVAVKVTGDFAAGLVVLAVNVTVSPDCVTKKPPLAISGIATFAIGVPIPEIGSQPGPALYPLLPVVISWKLLL